MTGKANETMHAKLSAQSSAHSRQSYGFATALSTVVISCSQVSLRVPENVWRNHCRSFSRAGWATLGTENGQSLEEPPHTCLICLKSRTGLWELHLPITLLGDVPAGSGFPGHSVQQSQTPRNYSQFPVPMTAQNF